MRWIIPRSYVHTCLIAAALACAHASPGAAQSVLHLARPTATSSHDFSGVTSVRELQSGELLVADGIDNQLYVLDADLRAMRTLGRQGSGPLEYRSPRMLFALAADSTLIPDGANRRWLVAKGAALAATVASGDAAVRSSGASLVGADTFARVAAIRRSGTRTRGAGFTVESLLVVTTQRRDGRADTLARLRGRPVETRELERNTSTNPMMATALGMPLETSEQALLFEDGWLAIARLEPYRIEWFDRAGTRMSSAIIPHEPIVVNDAEKRAHAVRIRNQMAIPGASRSDAPRPGASWPPVASPFSDNALHAGPHGELLVLRRNSANAPGRRYDIVTRTGRVRATLETAGNERVVGYGRNAIYVALEDSNGLSKVRRHTWGADFRQNKDAAMRSSPF